MATELSQNSPSNRRPLLWLAIAVFLLHVLVTPGHLLSTDGELLYRQAESIALSGSTQVIPLEADLATGLLPQGLPPTMTFATVFVPEQGVFYAQYLPLQPLLTAPLIWFSNVTSPLAPSVAEQLWPTMTTSMLDRLPEDQRELGLYRRFLVVTFFNSIVAALTAVLIARMGRLLTGERKAGIVAAALWAFGTMAWPHSRTYFTEPLAGLFVLAALDQTIRWFKCKDSSAARHAILAGAALALANWTRVDSPLFTVGLVPAMGVLALWKWVLADSWAERPRLPLVEVVAVGIISVAAFALLQLFNAWRFGGGDLTAGYGDQEEGVQFSTPLLIGLHGLLFSSGKGLFWFSPAVILGIWGWMRIPKQMRWVALLSAATYIPFFIAMAKWRNWDGGWCWGPRHIVQIFPVVMLGAAFLFTGALNWKRKIVTAIVAPVAVAVQLYGGSQDPLSYYHEYYRTFDDLEYHTVNLTPNQSQFIQREFVVSSRSDDGAAGIELSPARFPAPMIDALYIPQHTQWYSNAQMWRLGYRDWFFWTLIFGEKNPDRWRITDGG